MENNMDGSLGKDEKVVQTVANAEKNEKDYAEKESPFGAVNEIMIEEEIQEDDEEIMISKEVPSIVKNITSSVNEGSGKRKNLEKIKKSDKICKKKPNHFFAIQVSDSLIREKVSLVQNAIIQAQPKLQTALIPLPSLHLTLGVMHLANQEEIDKAVESLSEVGKELQPVLALEPLRIHFRSLGHFGNKVVFAQISSPERMTTIVKEFRAKVQANGLELTDDFKPHLTLLKLSRDPRLFRKGIRKISANYYEEHLDLEFGYENVTKFQLLSMNDPKDQLGYYSSKGEFVFDVQT